MASIDVLGSQAGRALRVLVGGGMLLAGRRRGGAGGTALAVAGLVPLGAGVADVCVLAPLVGGPFRGADFRTYRQWHG